MHQYYFSIVLLFLLIRIYNDMFCMSICPILFLQIQIYCLKNNSICLCNWLNVFRHQIIWIMTIISGWIFTRMQIFQDG